MKWLTLLCAAILTMPAYADDGADVLLDLDEYTDDANDSKMTGAQKLRFLNKAGRELGKSLVYPLFDTIITVVDQESYAMNSDAVGVLRGGFSAAGGQSPQYLAASSATCPASTLPATISSRLFGA